MINFFSFLKTKKKSTSSLNKRQSRKQRSKYILEKYGKTNTELCKKYKDRSVRNTPKNWAYNRCIKSVNWSACKKLPPSGYSMGRDFCCC